MKLWLLFFEITGNTSTENLGFFEPKQFSLVYKEMHSDDIFQDNRP